MRQYGVLLAIPMSFFSKDLYRDVAINWGGKAFAYLLLIIALSWIALTFQFQYGINKFYAKNSAAFVQQIPVMTFKDGKLSTPENRPYFIKDPSTHEVIAVIDTSGQYATLEQSKSSLLVTQTQVISEPKPNETRTYTIAKTINYTLDPLIWNGYMKDFISFAWLFMFIAVVVASFVFRVIQALVYGILGKIFAAICGVNISYGQIIQITLVAITPALVIATIFDSLHIQIPHEYLSYFILTALYIFYGVIANKTEAK